MVSEITEAIKSVPIKTHFKYFNECIRKEWKIYIKLSAYWSCEDRSWHSRKFNNSKTCNRFEIARR